VTLKLEHGKNLIVVTTIYLIIKWKHMNLKKNHLLLNMDVNTILRVSPVDKSSRYK